MVFSPTDWHPIKDVSLHCKPGLACVLSSWQLEQHHDSVQICFPCRNCLNIPNGLDRPSFCCSCAECFFPQVFIQVPCCRRDAIAGHISTRHLAGFPVGVLLYCFGGFHLPSSLLIAKRWDRKKSEEAIKCKRCYMKKHRGKSFHCLDGPSFGG